MTKKEKNMAKNFMLFVLIALFSSCAFYSDQGVKKDPNFVSVKKEDQGTSSLLSKHVQNTDSVDAAKVAEMKDYPLSLHEAILLTLQNNLDIKVSNYDSQMAGYSLEGAKGIYDTVFSASVSKSRSEDMSGTDPDKISAAQRAAMRWSSRSDATAASVALDQLLPTGATIGITYNHSRSRAYEVETSSFDPMYNESYTLNFTQPLLKGFGPIVTNSGITIARINKKITTERLKKQVMTQVYDIINSYWDLVYSIENLEVLKLSKKQAEDLLRINTIKYETGVLPQTDVLQAKAQVSSREAQIISAEAQIKANQDNLKQIMNIKPGQEKWNFTFVPSEKPLKDAFQPNEVECINKALSIHPDIVSLKKSLEIAKLNAKINNNMQNPSLNLIANYGNSGKWNHYETAMSKMYSGKYTDWQIGLQYQFPLLNREARYKYKKSLAEVNQTETELRNAEDQLSLGIRSAVRNIDTNYRRIDITNTSVEFEQANLDAEQKRYEVGMSTSFNILSFQQSFLAAKVQHLSSIIDYNKSLAGLEYSTGTILDTLKINVQETKEEKTFMDKILMENQQ